MNKISKLILLFSVMLLLDGCTQNAPVLSTNSDELKTNATIISDDSNVTGGNMIGITDSPSGGTLGRTPNGASEMNSGNIYNSSSDGFASLYFDVNSYGISSDMQTRVDKNIANYTKNPMNIKITGNCDESGTDEYNYALGLKRAKAIKDAMISGGVVENTIAIVSLGESTPVCTEDTEECKMRNRRVDIKKAN
jgi:peptidoglycan-associated lipoprotein